MFIHILKKEEKKVAFVPPFSLKEVPTRLQNTVKFKPLSEV